MKITQMQKSLLDYDADPNLDNASQVVKALESAISMFHEIQEDPSKRNVRDTLEYILGLVPCDYEPPTWFDPDDAV